MQGARRLRTVSSYFLLYAFFVAVLVASHTPYFDLPYFWDEMGQFVPAALDIYTEGAWIPKSTLPNVHPPGVMAYLACVWKIFGYSVPITRVAMLAFAAASAVAMFALAVRLCSGLSGLPAFSAITLLLCSPLFYTQAMMAQLDMVPMFFTALALLWFLNERFAWSTAACVALVLMKETSIVVPAVLGTWLLLLDRRVRPALYYLAPAVALIAWLVYLAGQTGYIFGNPDFARYNTTFQFHPVRLPLTLLRRVYYLFIGDFHWIGTVALIVAFRQTNIFRSRAWAVVASAFVAQVIAVTVLGGAALERYVLPVLPLFYIAVAAAWATFRPRWRRLSLAGMALGLAASLFINPIFPFPFENNLAVVDFVQLQRRAAEYVESHYAGATIVSAWPFPDTLRRPEFGYVTRPLQVKGLDNFNTSTVRGAVNGTNVLVVYSRTWEPKVSVLRAAWVKDFLARYYFYEPQISATTIEQELGLRPVARWEQRGQWIGCTRGRRLMNSGFEARVSVSWVRATLKPTPIRWHDTPGDRSRSSSFARPPERTDNPQLAW
jgi:hypothetical protein